MIEIKKYKPKYFNATLGALELLIEKDKEKNWFKGRWSDKDSMFTIIFLKKNMCLY